MINYYLFNQLFNQYATNQIYHKGELVVNCGSVFVQVLWNGILCPRYLISDIGIVYDTQKDRFLSQSYDKDGYLRVSINIPNVGLKTVRVHRLEYMTFNPLPDGFNYEDFVVNHSDGNKQNNYVTNLEWTSSIENTRHGWRTGLNTNYGEGHGQSVITDEEVHKICALIDQGYKNSDICDIFGKFERDIRSRFSALVSSIRYGKTHIRISSGYNFMSGVHKIDYSEQFAYMLCLTLSNGHQYTYKEIMDLFRIPAEERIYCREFINSLLDGYTYKNIAANFKMTRPLNERTVNDILY